MPDGGKLIVERPRETVTTQRRSPFSSAPVWGAFAAVACADGEPKILKSMVGSSCFAWADSAEASDTWPNSCRYMPLTMYTLGLGTIGFQPTSSCNIETA